MANPEHLAILEKGVQTWNEWRRHNPGVKPDLSLINIQAVVRPRLSVELSTTAMDQSIGLQWH